MNKTWVVLAAFIAAIFFFICAVFGADIGMTDFELLAAGLLSMAAGFLIERIPG